ncbi:hypothetical protein ACCO45_014037 [Purpureocillium lilacinum]|uniref:Uncharacterized protein n=1 Tax=Purpureocillium lilacinum TaxID=33203 RepID=A0ACC4D7M2_PURLI
MEGGHGVAGGRKHSTVPAFLGAFLRSPCIRSLAASFFHPYFRAGRAYVCYLLGRGGRIIASLNETCTTRRLPPGQHRGVLMRRVIHIPSYNSLARFPPLVPRVSWLSSAGPSHRADKVRIDGKLPSRHVYTTRRLAGLLLLPRRCPRT